MVLAALAFSAPAQCQEPKERFDRLSISLAELSDEYANDTMKTISFLLLAMGWLITSERSRAYLGGNRLARQAALTAIPALAMMHALTAAQTYFASQGKMETLFNLDYLKLPYYADDEITLKLLIVNLAIHTVLFATVFVLVWASKQGNVVKAGP